MLPTPDLSHLTEEDYIDVYEPAEDSFALLDALENDRMMLRSISTCPLVLEIGSGSGIISSFIQSQILSSSIHFTTDINTKAVLATLRTSQQNCEAAATFLDGIRTNLLDGLKVGLVDILVFNPPYVPTPRTEIDTVGTISAAWAGGHDGSDVIWQILPKIASIMSAGALFYLVTVSRNKPDDILKISEELNLDGHAVLVRKAGRERLTILRFKKRQ